MICVDGSIVCFLTGDAFPEDTFIAGIAVLGCDHLAAACPTKQQYFIPTLPFKGSGKVRARLRRSYRDGHFERREDILAPVPYRYFCDSGKAGNIALQNVDA